jgi:hypothetical protein
MFIPFFSAALLTFFSTPLVRADFSVQTPNFTQVTPDFLYIYWQHFDKRPPF